MTTLSDLVVESRSRNQNGAYLSGQVLTLVERFARFVQNVNLLMHLETSTETKTPRQESSRLLSLIETLAK